MLLFLHNVTPHLHSTDAAVPVSTDAGKAEEDLLDYLVNSFQLDFGEGHLECYSQVGTSSAAELPVAYLLPLLSWGQASVPARVAYVPLKEMVPKARDEVPARTGPTTPSLLRAPPSFA